MCSLFCSFVLSRCLWAAFFWRHQPPHFFWLSVFRLLSFSLPFTLTPTSSGRCLSSQSLVLQEVSFCFLLPLLPKSCLEGIFGFVGCLSIIMSSPHYAKLFEVNYVVKRCHINKTEQNTAKFNFILALAANICVFPTIKSQNKCCGKRLLRTATN